MAINTDARECPCQSSRAYNDCFGLFHSGSFVPPTAEALMRSRYSAYVLEQTQYLLDTWHPSTKPATLDLEKTNWIGLKIKTIKAGTQQHREGWVQFVARCKVSGKAHKLEEHSYFVKEHNKWLYVKAC